MKKGVLGSEFEAYGNEPQCFVTDVPAWEYLPGGNVRLFVCTARNGVNRVDHEAIVPLCSLLAIAHKLIEIASNTSATDAINLAGMITH